MTINPAGPTSGLTKVIRGGGLDSDGPFFRRASNRASTGPGFPPENNAVYRGRIAKQLEEDAKLAQNTQTNEKLIFVSINDNQH